MLLWKYAGDDDAAVNDECLIEIDLDLDDLARDLRLEGVVQKAQEYYLGRVRLDGSGVFDHARRVATAARKIACQVYADDLMGARRYWPKVCEAAGYLHEAPARACLSFEDLVAVADEATARAVGAMAPDFRHPRPRRNEALANALGSADLPARLVKLADLRDTAHFLLEAYDRGQGGAQEVCADFCYEARELLPVYRHRPEGLPSLCEAHEAVAAVAASLEALLVRLERRVFPDGRTPQRRERRAPARH